MYMPLEVPLGELAVAPVNPVHEELVRKGGGLNFRRLFWPFVVETKLILLPLRSSSSLSTLNKKSIQITVARFSHDEELLWTGDLMDLTTRENEQRHTFNRPIAAALSRLPCSPP